MGGYARESPQRSVAESELENLRAALRQVFAGGVRGSAADGLVLPPRYRQSDQELAPSSSARRLARPPTSPLRKWLSSRSIRPTAAGAALRTAGAAVATAGPIQALLLRGSAPPQKVQSSSPPEAWSRERVTLQFTGVDVGMP